MNFSRKSRAIEIDGAVKGAALVFRPTIQANRAPALHRPAAPALPGIEIGGTGLKIVGKSDAILAALDTVNRIASVNEPTLIEGQTGAGKELFARLIQSRMDPAGIHHFRPIHSCSCCWFLKVR